MSSLVGASLGLLAGIALGASHQWILWASIRATVRSRTLLPLAIGWAVRIVQLAFAGALLALAGGGAAEMLSTLAGFMIVRGVSISLSRTGATKRPAERAA